MLNLWDRHGIKVTSHMIGEAVQRHPELAREIVSRGHEASGHGPRWSSQYGMTRDEEKQFLITGADMVGPRMGRVRDLCKRRPGVAFMRKDEIARFALQSPLTLRETETI